MCKSERASFATNFVLHSDHVFSCVGPHIYIKIQINIQLKLGGIH